MISFLHGHRIRDDMFIHEGHRYMVDVAAALDGKATRKGCCRSDRRS